MNVIAKFDLMARLCDIKLITDGHSCGTTFFHQLCDLIEFCARFCRRKLSQTFRPKRCRLVKSAPGQKRDTFVFIRCIPIPRCQQSFRCPHKVFKEQIVFSRVLKSTAKRQSMPTLLVKKEKKC
jgi:hypothetical protein